MFLFTKFAVVQMAVYLGIAIVVDGVMFCGAVERFLIFS